MSMWCVSSTPNSWPKEMKSGCEQDNAMPMLFETNLYELVNVLCGMPCNGHRKSEILLYVTWVGIKSKIKPEIESQLLSDFTI